MNSYNRILHKLKGFTTKYYTKRLIKGVLLFLAFGLLFWLVVLTVEYALWLDTKWRVVLFGTFVLVEAFLLYQFLLTPASFLFRLKKGISAKEASKLIGKHFPEVDDKLYNLLELSESKQESDLLLASIEQRSRDLGNVPFTEAINIRDSLKYVKYIVIPMALLGLIWTTGNIGDFFNSHQRVVNYDVAYEQPAPFQFVILNDNLEILDNQALDLEVLVQGDVIPEEVYIVVEGENLLMKNQNGVFRHRFLAPIEEMDFYLTANGWDSKTYHVSSIKTPSLIDFQMELDYPDYIGRTSEMISGTGNAVVPEGTMVKWLITGRNVDGIQMHYPDSSFYLERRGELFDASKVVYSDLSYGLSTSNERIKDYERLEYSFKVVKDGRPTVQVEQVMDSLNPNTSFFTGQAADDYGLKEVSLVYFPADDENKAKRIVLERPNSNVHQFYYTFPSGLIIDKGKNYKIYFEIVDNDGIRGGKRVKSKTFSTMVLNDKQLKDKDLEFQGTVLGNMDRSLEKYKEQKEELSKINEQQKEQSNFDFEDKNRIKDFLQKQEEQEQLMEKFSRQLKESLEKRDSDDARKKLLKERLERQELEARKNEELLKELNELADKIDREELKKRLDELSKKQSSSARNLEQILELTKRYYVSEKMTQLARKLDDLAKEQEKLALENDEKETEKQGELNSEFEKIAEELDDLKKDNDALKKPMNLDVSEKRKESIKEDQQEALDRLKENDGKQGSSEQQTKQETEQQEKAAQKQKSAAQKMKEMSEGLEQGAMSGGGSSETEDAEMLRQILDNLVTFSFNQEQLFESVEEANVEISQFAKTVRDQKELRRLFEHVDDSLFALSLRRAELSEFVNEQITEVYYNIDKSLESIAENQIYQGASYQQYVVNATNSLADFLANILENMQQSMQSGQGSGQGQQDFQLPDIIQGQRGLQEKMNGSGEQKSGESGEKQQGEGEGSNEGGQNPKDGEGEENGEGKGEKSGSNEDGKGSGDGSQGDEMELSRVYEIYKEQQYIRSQLEKQLQDMILEEERNLAKKLIRQMEDFENDLLVNGITQRTKSKVNRIQHELLKLKNAALKQGKKKERESNTNQNEFTNPITTRPELLKDYQDNIEILNRQALPLRQNYQRKVKVYFKND